MKWAKLIQGTGDPISSGLSKLNKYGVISIACETSNKNTKEISL
jgi:hypothetical protein